MIAPSCLDAARAVVNASGGTVVRYPIDPIAAKAVPSAKTKREPAYSETPRKIIPTVRISGTTRDSVAPEKQQSNNARGAGCAQSESQLRRQRLGRRCSRKK